MHLMSVILTLMPPLLLMLTLQLLLSLPVVLQFATHVAMVLEVDLVGFRGRGRWRLVATTSPKASSWWSRPHSQ